jgi:hypothetical protein
MRCGALVGVLAYLGVGLVWIMILNIGLLGAPAGEFIRSLFLHPQALMLVLLWPLGIAQVAGLFGLSFG